MDSKSVRMQPIVSQAYSSPSEVILVVRKRPDVVNGGGFVVGDCSQRVVFRVDGCWVVGKKEELVLRDGEGSALLLMRHEGSIIEALSLKREWKSFTYDSGSSKPVFTLKQPTNSCFQEKTPIRISIGLESSESGSRGNFEIKGDFSDRSCSIVSSTGHSIAQIGVEEDVKEIMSGRDSYHVKIMPGVDQSFVFGVIAVLDYTCDASTRC